jgi:hypothetical protein
MPINRVTTIPDEQCEWCGEIIKWVRLLPSQTPIPIDADPVDTYDPMGRLGRQHPSKAGGRMDCVRYIGEDERWMYERTYVPHKMTCSQAEQWASGHRRTKKKQAKYGPRPDPIQEGDPDPRYA